LSQEKNVNILEKWGLTAEDLTETLEKPQAFGGYVAEHKLKEIVSSQGCPSFQNLMTTIEKRREISI
jgi:hypothetical protein